MLRPLLSSITLAVVIAVPSAQAPAEKIDAAMNAKIRAEGMDRSQVMRVMHMLTDVYGPRLTGSPNFDNAARWAVKEMESWGLKNGKLEPWNWGREGWLNEKASGHILAPVKDNLVFEVLAWTPSTKGTVVADAVHLIPPTAPAPTPVGQGPAGRGGAPSQGPTEAELTAYFAKMAPRVKGAIVLVGESRVAAFVETEGAKRQTDEAAKARFNPDPNAPAAPGRGGGNRGGGGGGGGRGEEPPQQGPVRLTTQQVASRVNDFLLQNGAAVRVNDSGRRHGQIIAFNAPGYVAAKTVPTVVMSNEDYGRIARILADGTRVQLEFTIVNQTYPNAQTSYNAIAEIPGTDKADEVVMLGGHLDSWHSSTGATDNAAGCAIMMEAVRILQAIGAKPRRTIRVGLWGGEEQGLLGSQAYVKEHFGSFEEPKPEFAKLSAYWNIDTGTGLVRGASIFGPPEGARVLAQFLKPWEEYKVYGAVPTSGRNIGGTDSTSFNNAGLAGMGGSQDGIEYGSHTHHTNLDAYERILPEDMKKNAIITASIIYHIAMRDELMPRFTKENMPPKPAGRGGGN